MGIDRLYALVTLLLAISLATERGVAILKTLIPWLAVAKVDPATEPTKEALKADRGRAFVVQLIAVVLAWATAALLSNETNFLKALIGKLDIGTGAAAFQLRTIVVGVLCSGGSAFWASIVEWAKAVKGARQARRAMEVAELRRLESGRGPDTTELAEEVRKLGSQVKELSHQSARLNEIVGELALAER